MKRLFYAILFLFLLLPLSMAYADPIQQQTGIAGYDPATRTWNYVCASPTTRALCVSLSGGLAGTHTPSDTYTNPTDAINSYSLLGGWNGTTWDRIKTVNTGSLITSQVGIFGAAQLLFDTFGSRYAGAFNLSSAVGSTAGLHIPAYSLIARDSVTGTFKDVFNALQPTDVNISDYLATVPYIANEAGTAVHRVLEPSPSTVNQTTGIPPAAILGSTGSGWNPIKVDTQSGLATSTSIHQANILLNSVNVSGVNSAVAITLTPAGNTRINLQRLDAWCSAGTSSITVQDGATTIWNTLATEVGTARLKETWPIPLSAGTTNNMVITLGACGGGNTGTLVIQADNF